MSTIFIEDYEFWLKSDSLTAEEFAAILIGYNPAIVNLKYLEDEHARRKEDLSHLTNGTSWEKELLEYKKILSLIFNAQKAKKLKENSKPIEYIKWAIGKNLEPANELLSEYEKIEKPQNKESLKTIERNTLLKIIIAMAIEKYGYTPNKSNHAATDISDSTNFYGIRVSDDTIRHWLKVAVDEVLPQDALSDE